MKIIIKPIALGILQFLGVLTVALLGLFGTTSCDCDTSQITIHVEPIKVNECITHCDATPLTDLLTVDRNNNRHYGGVYPPPPGSSINFLASRNGGETIMCKFVKICLVNGVTRVQICTGTALTPPLSANCSIVDFHLRIPCKCECYP